MYKYLKTSVKGSTTYVSSWESTGLSNEKKNSSITTSNYNQAPNLAYDNVRILDMVKHLIQKEVFHILAKDMAKMLLSSKLI